MKIEKNSRQIPKKASVVANKNYCDLLYGYLQEISFRDEELNKRYIEKKQINYSKIAEALNISRQTVQKYFKKLIEDMAIVEPLDKQKNRYYLVTLTNEEATLIPFETLQYLTDVCTEKAISTYVYLLNRYFAEGCKEYVVLHSHIKTYLGISTSTTSNNHVVNNILDALKKLGLIKYELRQLEYDKSCLYVTFVTNKVLKSC